MMYQKHAKYINSQQRYAIYYDYRKSNNSNPKHHFNMINHISITFRILFKGFVR